MLNPKEVISQAQDRKKENLEWVLRETELRQALGPFTRRKKKARVSFIGRAIEIMKSLILLKWPALGSK